MHAHPAVADENVVTILPDGREETTNVTKEGDWILTNPDGERYVIGNKEFLLRYTATDEEGVYEAHNFCKAIANPYNKPIEILASWGSLQFGDEHCMIADVCDGDGKAKDEPHLIDGSVFSNTYRQYERE